MNRLHIAIASLAIVCAASAPAGAWCHAGARGVAAGGDGSWSARGRDGGSASGGDGSWSGTGFRGSTASGGGGSWNAQGYRGGSASGGGFTGQNDGRQREAPTPRDGSSGTPRFSVEGFSGEGAARSAPVRGEPLQRRPGRADGLDLFA